MHWYTWALIIWAILSGVPALAVLCLVLPSVVAEREVMVNRRSPQLERQSMTLRRRPARADEPATD
jgi:hypothetical protein